MAPATTTTAAEAALAELQDCLTKHYRDPAAFPTVHALTSKVYAQEAGKPVAQDTDLIEIAFRAVLSSLVRQALSSGHDVLDEKRYGVRSLLDLALRLAQPKEAGGVPLGPRAAFFLLEDLFDLLGVEQIQAFWPEVEAREEALYRLFKVARKSNLTMLKLCNSLLRKLSKSHNTAICGRIMMYLSRNWELSDPSAINKGGAANQGNKTVYEDSDEFARQQERLAEKRRRDDELRAAVEGKGKGKEEDGQPIDYSLYQTFWGLQEHLSDPTRVQQSDEAWGEFVGKAKVVLQAFEGFTVSEESAAASAAKAIPVTTGVAVDERTEEGGGGGEGGEEEENPEGKEDKEGEEEGAREKEEEEEEQNNGDNDEDDEEKSKGPSKKRSRKTPSSSSTSSSSSTAQQTTKKETMEAYLGCKYLTNSRLFRLQLHDPLVRVQVLTQLLILLNYVSASATLAAASSTHPPSPSSTKGSGHGSAASNKPGANDLAKHARRLIRSTPPHGSAYLATLETVLDREKAWLAWKKVQRCEPKIEKPKAPPAKTIRAQEIVKKALSTAGKPTVVVAQQQRASYGQALPLPRAVDLAAVEEEVAGGIDRTFESYIVPRVEEANDPEACIDEEYHPRHEPVFCWRALRLAWAASPKALIDLGSGSLDELYRRAKGLPEPDVKEEEVERGGEGMEVAVDEKEEMET